MKIPNLYDLPLLGGGCGAGGTDWGSGGGCNSVASGWSMKRWFSYLILQLGAKIRHPILAWQQVLAISIKPLKHWTHEPPSISLVHCTNP